MTPLWKTIQNDQSNPTNAYTVPSVSIAMARTGASSKANALGMARPHRVFEQPLHLFH